MEEKKFEKYGFVYRIECKKTGKFYIGSTIHLSHRVHDHVAKNKKGRCNDLEEPELKCAKLHNYKNLKELREFEKIEIKKHINNDLCINKNIPNRGHREYYIDNKEHILTQSKRKLTCECGAIVSARHMARHRRCFKHTSYIDAKKNII